MIVFRGTEEITKDFHASFVTIGNFDGVHLSHRHICRKLADEARETGAKSLVITFDPHPKMILHPDIRPFFLITTLEEKLSLLEQCGIDGVAESGALLRRCTSKGYRGFESPPLRTGSSTYAGVRSATHMCP